MATQVVNAFGIVVNDPNIVIRRINMSNPRHALILLLTAVVCFGTGEAAIAQERESGSKTRAVSLAGSGSCRLMVGDNIQVSDIAKRLGAYVYETQIAVNPKNSRNLIASGLYHLGDPKDSSAQEALAYVSEDGGRSWRRGKRPAATFREGDATLIFDRRGTAYYYTIGEKGNFLSRSTDQGRSWTVPTRVSGFIDHVTLATDLGKGSYGGNLYGLGGDRTKENSRAVDTLFFTVSKDRGMNWDVKKMTTVDALGPDYFLVGSVMSLLVSREGRLSLPFVAGVTTNGKINLDSPNSYHWITFSDDGGKTFARPRQLHLADGSPLMKSGRVSWWGIGYAIDTTLGPFDGRLYTAWMEEDAATQMRKLFFSFSDGGDIWSAPNVVETAAIDNREGVLESSVLPTVSVNNRGVLILSWYRFTAPEDAADKRSASYQRYITASLDGGATFLPTVPLASQPTPDYEQFGFKNGRLGDYLNTTAGPDGIFHALWMDGRTGTQQMWYSSIRVECEGKPAVANSSAPSKRQLYTH